MRRLLCFLNRLTAAVTAAAFGLAAAPAWAQDFATASADDKPYPALYLLVFLCIVFGLLIVLRPVDRDKEVRKNLP